MKRKLFSFAVLTLAFLPPSLTPQQVSSSQPPSYYGTDAAPVGTFNDVAMPAVPPDLSRMRPWRRYAQHGTRALRATPKSQGASYTVPVNFAAAVDYNSGAYGGGGGAPVAVAEVNGDGKPDLLIGSDCATNAFPCPADGVVSVLLGNGDGTFQAAVTYDSGGSGAPAIAVADVNGDSKPDLLLASNCVSLNAGCVTVLLGNGDGTFQKAVPYNSGGIGADSIAVADVNGDGKPDLLVANSCMLPCSSYPTGTDGAVSVLLGNGDGTFQNAVTYDSGGQGANSIAVADLRGNGKLDIAVVNCAATGSFEQCNKGDGVVSILLGNSDGTFQTAVPYDTGGADSNSVAIADLNGDGKLDLVVSDACVGGNLCNTDGAAAVLLGSGDGTFQAAVTYDSGYGTEAIAVADVNGDGKLDLIVASDCTTLGGNCPTSLVGVLMGNGDGTFQAAVFFGSGGTYISSVAVEDINGDGKPDVVGGNPCAASGCSGAESTAAVLLNTTLKGPAAAVSPTSLNFANQAAGTTSPSQVVTLTSTGTVNLTLNSVSFTGTNTSDFAQTNNCGSSLAPGASCQINVTFTPTGGPSRGATLQLTDSAPGSPQVVALTGSVQDFSLAATSQTSLTVAAGQVANYAIAISPVNGFTAQVALSCTGEPQLSTCDVSPGSVTVNSSGASANIVVTTSGTSAKLAHPADFPPATGTQLALWLAMSGAFGLVSLDSRVRRPGGKHRAWFYGLTALCLLCLTITWSACGNGTSKGSGSGTPSGTYNLTVMGTYTSGSTTMTNSTKLTLVVR